MRKGVCYIYEGKRKGAGSMDRRCVGWLHSEKKTNGRVSA